MFSSGIFKANWKRFWIVPIIMTIILFLGITFQMIMEMESIKKEETYQSYVQNIEVKKSADEEIIKVTNTDNKTNTITSTSSVDAVENVVKTNDITTNQRQGKYLIRILYNPLNIVAIFIIPVLLSILLFSYMNEEKSSCFIHGLPISRKKLYFTNIVTGICIYIVPYLINFIILRIFNFGEMGNYLQNVELWKWLGMNIVYNTLFFSLATMVGMLCASKIAHGILTYLFMYVPIGIFVFFSKILEEILYGFNGFTTKLEEIILKIPFISIINDFSAMKYGNESMQIELKTICIYVVIVIGMFLLGYYIYTRRKLEITKEFIAFKKIASIIKYIGTFGIQLLSFSYFYMIFEENKITSMIGSLVIAGIAYIIIEMILKKTYKVHKSIKGFIIYTVCIIILYSVIVNGGLGFETRIPNLEEIREIVITKNGETVLFDEKENMKAILNLHQKIVEERKDGYSNYVIEYTLKNGKKINRKYAISKERYEEELRKIFDSQEYIEESVKIFQNIEDIENITIEVQYITENYRYNRKEIQIEEKDKHEFMQVLIQDIRNRKAFINGDYAMLENKIEKEDTNIRNVCIKIRLKNNIYKIVNYQDIINAGICTYIE